MKLEYRYNHQAPTSVEAVVSVKITFDNNERTIEIRDCGDCLQISVCEPFGDAIEIQPRASNMIILSTERAR